ncbi:MAG: PAC2 family protein [Candidatus Lokiarchaeota archaeon]|nr:PAC2 family protein [Candidatus Lokiarchaeota archaeon]
MHITIEKKFDLEKENIKNPVLLIGWPGIALVAKLAITSIQESLQAQELLEIQYFDFPAKAIVEKGSLEIPNATVFYKATDKDDGNDFFILTGSYQPQTPEGVFEFAKVFCEEIHKMTGGINMYVSTGAMISEIVNDKPSVYVCGTDQDLVQTFLELENTKLYEGGYISGANGILPAWAGAKGYAPGICLLAETLPLPMMTLDPRSSKALVAILMEYFSIEMDFSKLNEKIKEMEGIFESFKKQADQFMKPPREDRGSDSYFR